MVYQRFGTISWAAVALSFLVTAEVFAQSRESAYFEWRKGAGAEACISKDSLRSAVNWRLGREALTEPGGGQATAVVDAAIESVDMGRWALTVSFIKYGQPVGTRRVEVEASECQQLNDAIILTLSLIADEPASFFAADEEEVSTEAPLGRQLGLEVHVGALFTYNAVPCFGVAPQLAVSMVGLPIPRLQLQAAGWIPATRPSYDVAVRVRAWQLGIGACPWTVSFGEGFRFEPCVTASAGRWHGTGEGLPASYSETRWSVHATVEPTLHWQVSRRFSMRASVGALAIIRRPHFSFVQEDGSERDLYEPYLLSPFFGFAFGAGL